MRPVDEPPSLVERLDIPIAAAQRIDEALEHAVVVEQHEPGLVVHLEADDRRVRGMIDP